MNQLGLTTGGSSLSFHWQAEASSEVYLTLLRDYLVFMVPEIVPQLTDTTLAPPENILTTLLLKSSSPIWSRIDTGSRYSAFFTGILVEFWMNSYGYGVDELEILSVILNSFCHLLISFKPFKLLPVIIRVFTPCPFQRILLPAYVDPAYKTLATEAFGQVRLSFTVI